MEALRARLVQKTQSLLQSVSQSVRAAAETLVLRRPVCFVVRSKLSVELPKCRDDERIRHRNSTTPADKKKKIGTVRAVLGSWSPLSGKRRADLKRQVRSAEQQVRHATWPDSVRSASDGDGAVLWRIWRSKEEIHSERLAFEGSGSGVLRLRAECKMHMQAEVGCNSVPQSSNIAAHSLVHAPRKRNATPAGCIW